MCFGLVRRLSGCSLLKNCVELAGHKAILKNGVTKNGVTKKRNTEICDVKNETTPKQIERKYTKKHIIAIVGYNFIKSVAYHACSPTLMDSR